jgi:hypothetical protein
MPNPETQRLMAVKAALVVTTNTAGWQYVKQIAENVVKAAIQAALDEDDSVKGESLRRKAKAAQEIFRDLFNVIETSKAFGTDDEPGWFTDLADQEPERE